MSVAACARISTYTYTTIAGDADGRKVGEKEINVCDEHARVEKRNNRIDACVQGQCACIQYRENIFAGARFQSSLRHAAAVCIYQRPFPVFYRTHEALHWQQAGTRGRKRTGENKQKMTGQRMRWTNSSQADCLCLQISVYFRPVESHLFAPGLQHAPHQSFMSKDGSR